MEELGICIHDLEFGRWRFARSERTIPLIGCMDATAVKFSLIIESWRSNARQSCKISEGLDWKK